MATGLEAANDNNPAVILDGLLTPEAIADRIHAACGQPISARAVWEKARRIGVSRKIGRIMLISVNDIPDLLKEENKKWRSTSVGKSTISASVGPTDSTAKVRSLLQKKKRSNSRKAA